MENDKLYRKIISVLAIPISPIVSFLFSLKYFSSIYGGIFFILFGVFLNTSLAFHQREDITRMVDIYKQLSFSAKMSYEILSLLLSESNHLSITFILPIEYFFIKIN